MGIFNRDQAKEPNRQDTDSKATAAKIEHARTGTGFSAGNTDPGKRGRGTTVYDDGR